MKQASLHLDQNQVQLDNSLQKNNRLNMKKLNQGLAFDYGKFGIPLRLTAESDSIVDVWEIGINLEQMISDFISNTHCPEEVSSWVICYISKSSLLWWGYHFETRRLIVTSKNFFERVNVFLLSFPWNIKDLHISGFIGAVGKRDEEIRAWNFSHMCPSVVLEITIDMF